LVPGVEGDGFAKYEEISLEAIMTDLRNMHLGG
jgi:hypothetical protein